MGSQNGPITRLKLDRGRVSRESGNKGRGTRFEVRRGSIQPTHKVQNATGNCPFPAQPALAHSECDKRFPQKLQNPRTRRRQTPPLQPPLTPYATRSRSQMAHMGIPRKSVGLSPLRTSPSGLRWEARCRLHLRCLPRHTSPHLASTCRARSRSSSSPPQLGWGLFRSLING